MMMVTMVVMRTAMAMHHRWLAHHIEFLSLVLFFLNRIDCTTSQCNQREAMASTSAAREAECVAIVRVLVGAYDRQNAGLSAVVKNPTKNRRLFVWKVGEGARTLSLKFSVLSTRRSMCSPRFKVFSMFSTMTPFTSSISARMAAILSPPALDLEK